MVEEFIIRMAQSNHDEKFRLKVTNDAITKYRKLKEGEKEGRRPLYRNRQEIIASRKTNKDRNSKSSWFRKAGYNATLRVQYTPSGELARRIKWRLNSEPELKEMRILVTEQNGDQIRQISNFADPKKDDFCRRHDCYVCLTAESPVRGKCYLEGIGYTITCRLCSHRGLK